MDNKNFNKKNTEELKSNMSILALILAVMIICNIVITSLTFDRIRNLEKKLDDITYEKSIETIETIVESDVITNEAIDIPEIVVETEPVETVAETKIIETVAETEVKVTPVISTPTNGTKMTLVATAYCPCMICCGKTNGITATGTKATAGRTIAVDPRVIPYGSKVIINGNTYIAEDCGGAIQNNRIDIFFDTHQEAIQWGIRTVEAIVITE